MKKTSLSFLLSCTLFSVFAQFTGKPIYNIECRRADTLLGNIEVELFPNIAPNHVSNWDSLVNISAFDSSEFHRVISGFVIQGGELIPTPSTHTVNAEFSEVPHSRGRLSAARTPDPNSATSQYFICHADAFSLDNQYSVYGETTAGMDIVDIIANVSTDANDKPLVPIRMYITRIGSNDSIPPSPSLISPNNNEVGVTSSTNFSWSEVSYAKLYLFEIAEDSLFNNVVFSKETKRLNANFPYLNNSFSKYYWRVRTNNGGNYSEDYEVRKFENTLGTPLQILPENASYTTTYTFFDWSDVAQSDGYRLQLSSASTFGNPFLILLDTVVENSSFKIKNAILDINRKYYWRVVAYDSNGEGDYSPILYYNTNSTDGIRNLIVEQIEIFPNPVDDVFNLTLNSNSILHIYDLKGNLVYTSNLVKGENIVNIDVLETGTYTVQVIGNDKVYVSNLIKK